MLQAIQDLFARLTDGSHTDFEDNDYRLAAAALLVHVSKIDGGIADVESERLHAVLQKHFSLSETETDDLISEAVEADNQAVDLFGFTRLILRALDEPGRVRIVEMIWEIIYADGRVTEFEDNVVWRAADLLGISGRDRIEARQRVSQRFAQA